MKLLVYFSSVAIAFITLIGAGVVFDCRMAVSGVQSSVSELDTEMKKHEERYNELLNGIDDQELRDLLLTYEKAGSLHERQQIFNQIAQRASVALSNQFDNNSNPAMRRLNDELAGQLNRRSIVQKSFDDAELRRSKVCESWKGRIVQCEQ